MATKKNFKVKNLKNPLAGQDVSKLKRKKILGLDVQEVGAAIATAVVAEIAQIAVNKVAHRSQTGSTAASTLDSAVDNSAEAVGQTQSLLKEAGGTVLETLAEAAPLQTALGVLNEAFSNAKPAVSGAVSDSVEATKQIPQAVSHSVQDSVEGTVATTQANAEDASQLTSSLIGSAIGAAKGSADGFKQTAQTAVGDVTRSLSTAIGDDKKTKQKHKKNKKKSDKKKEKKRNKK